MKSIMKEGWHPKAKDGGEESWRSDFKGINQVVRIDLIHCIIGYSLTTSLFRHG